MYDTDIEFINRGHCTEVACGVFNLDRSFEKKFSVMNINIRSLKSNFSGLLKFLNSISAPPTVIVVTESWLSDDTVKFYDIPGYRKEFMNRASIGGGILMYYCSALTATRHAKLTGIFPTHESLCVTLKGPNVSYKLLCIYRPPNRDNESDFVKYFQSLQKRSLGANCICVGDFNLCTMGGSLSKSKKSAAFNTCMLGKNFENAITYPTFYSYLGNASLLDHTWYNGSTKYKSFVFDAPIADHCPTLCVFMTDDILPDQVITFRDFSDKNIIAMTALLPRYVANLNECLAREPDLDNKICLLDQWFHEILNRHFPIMKKPLPLND